MVAPEQGYIGADRSCEELPLKENDAIVARDSPVAVGLTRETLTRSVNGVGAEAGIHYRPAQAGAGRLARLAWVTATSQHV